MENKKFDWNKRIGNSEKGTSDYVAPWMSWSLIGGAVLICIIIAVFAI